MKDCARSDPLLVAKFSQRVGKVPSGMVSNGCASDENWLVLAP